MKRNTNQNCKQDHSLKEIHAEYFQTLENKLLQESQRLTIIMGKPLIQDKSKKRFKFTLTPTKIVTQDLDKSRSRLTVKNETKKPEPIYMKRMKQLYQKFKQHNLHFGDNLQHIKQLCPRQKYETQRQKIYNLVNKYEQTVICDREKLGRSKKLHRFCKESQSLKDTISTQSCKSLKNITEQSINYLGMERITLNDFEIINHIAQGKIGHVYTFRHKRTNFLCAMKKIQLSVFINNNKMLTQRIRQIKIQSFLDHPNIVQLYSVFTDQHHLYLLMELCSSGSLYQQLKAQSKFCEQKIRNIVKQICHAVEYMHDNDIIHRDLKPQNILFHENIVKICDFDWSVYSPLLRNTNCDTPVYTSPQIVQGLQYDNKVDVWNIGNLTYELLYGRVPFQIRSEEDLSKVVDDDIYFPRSKPATPQIKDFILRCLSKNPKQRFTIAKLIDHQFLNPSVQGHNLT